MPIGQINKIIRTRQVLSKIGLSMRTLSRLIKRGQFPLPIKGTMGANCWSEHVIDTWIKDKPEVINRVLQARRRDQTLAESCGYSDFLTMIEDKIINEKMSIPEFSNLYGVPKTSVRQYLIKYGYIGLYRVRQGNGSKLSSDSIKQWHRHGQERQFDPCQGILS